MREDTTVQINLQHHDEPTGLDWQFRYNGSLTVNVWAGLDPDYSEVDVFTLNEPTGDIAELIAHAKEYLRYREVVLAGE